MSNVNEIATFAAGCFWGVEDIFRTQPGVLETEVGYTGGHVDNVTYKQVCYENTGHAEAVNVTFDPSQTTYEQLVRIFFDLHDPTTMNRQGPDVGSQYRSAIFYHSAEQKQIAEKIKNELTASGGSGHDWAGDTVVTEIVVAGPFWRAEEYHQKYFLKNPDDPRVCHTLPPKP
jgi:methionine-S-sulfoxide reductase